MSLMKAGVSCFILHLHPFIRSHFGSRVNRLCAMETNVPYRLVWVTRFSYLRYTTFYLSWNEWQTEVKWRRMWRDASLWHRVNSDGLREIRIKMVNWPFKDQGHVIHIANAIPSTSASEGVCDFKSLEGRPVPVPVSGVQYQ